MTYCVAMSLDAGMIFASDSRTNAGVDQIARFSKMKVFAQEGEYPMRLFADDLHRLINTPAKQRRVLGPTGQHLSDQLLFDSPVAPML